MSNTAGRIISIIVIAIIITTGLFAHRFIKQQAKPSSQDQPYSAANVQTTIVTTGPIEESLVLTGEIRPIVSVEVRPKISGRLQRLALDDGRDVAEGVHLEADQVIAVIEHEDLKAQLAQAKAAVETANAAVLAAQVNLDDRRREKARIKNLFKDGSATEQQRDRAIAEYDRAAAALEQANAQLAQAQAGLQLAQAMFDEAFIRSPIKGVVTVKHVDPGTIVNPATAILTIQAIDQLKVFVAIPGLQLPRIDTERTAVEIGIEGYQSEAFDCRINKVYPSVDPATRTATVEILIQNRRNQRSEYILRPGLYATVRLVLERRDNAVVVPANALIRVVDQYYVFLVVNDKAVRQKVQVGLRTKDMVEVVDGLVSGQEIVVSGQHRLTDQMSVVRIQQEGGQ